MRTVEMERFFFRCSVAKLLILFKQSSQLGTFALFGRVTRFCRLAAPLADRHVLSLYTRHMWLP